jgi:predicted ribosomally synthesized peptide with SipW-like signal peptide
MKKKVLATSLLTILLCVCLIAGSTYALFADDESMNITVTAGKLEIEAKINTTLKAWSLGQTENNAVSGTTVTFVNGGTATLSNGELIIDRMTPGDTVQFTVDITNKSNINRIKCVVKVLSYRMEVCCVPS